MPFISNKVGYTKCCVDYYRTQEFPKVYLKTVCCDICGQHMTLFSSDLLNKLKYIENV